MRNLSPKNITSDINGLNITIKRQRQIGQKESKTQLYAAYKRPNLNIKSQTGQNRKRQKNTLFYIN